MRNGKVTRCSSAVGFVFLTVSCSGERPVDGEASTAAEAPASRPTAQPVAVVRDSSVGCLELGAPLDAVTSACGEVTDTVLRLEGQPQPAVWVDVKGGRALAESVNGLVWRIRVTDPRLQTADSIGAGTPVSRLAESPGIRIAYGEGVFARLAAHCGKSFALSGLPYRQGGWTANQLRAQPDTVAVAMILVVGDCDHG